MLTRILLILLFLLVTPSAFADELGSARDIGPLAAKVAELGDAAKPDELDGVTDDPVTLRALSRHVRKDDEARSKLLFDRALEKEEINHYERLAGSSYADAMRDEEFGDFEAARKTWRAAAKLDPLTTYILLSRYSRDEQRETLREEIRALVKSLHDAAGNSAAAPIYTSARGTVRNLTRLSDEDALAALMSGESLSYVSINTLDLTGKTFDKPVGCSRCVIGEIKGWESSFTAFSFRGFILGNAHFGKAWTGEVNRSRSLPPATFDELLFDKAIVFGDLEMDSVAVKTAAGFPFLVVDGEADFRNTHMSGDVDMRFGIVGKSLILEGAELHGASYFGHLHAGGLELTRLWAPNSALLFDSSVFTGDVRAARCKLDRGATFENATFGGELDVHHCQIAARLNLSRAQFQGPAGLSYVELDDLDVLGARAAASFSLTDSVVRGNARFALDGFTRRQHLADPSPLHTLYKQYQGDVDADQLLTESSQYGVTHVDDLVVRFASDTSFANTYFEKFVGFEGVTFGSKDTASTANFYNAQMYGEAHFERTNFQSTADFRTISGNELSFNSATFSSSWMLDDANVPGRLSLSEVKFAEGSNLSFRGARLAFFGITIEDLIAPDGRARQFYQRCADDGRVDIDDPRLLSARWDEATETARPDGEAKSLAQRLCLEYAIAEFVVLRDSFTKRGMTQEADWAYWNLRHSRNLHDRIYAATATGVAAAWVEWVFFENAFGWGVRLHNLFLSSLFVIFVFMLLFRTLCPNVMLDWDDSTMPLRDLPGYALFVISLHSFLGRARDWKSKSSNKIWKVLYTTEMIIGILLITFFIGAYARIILR